MNVPNASANPSPRGRVLVVDDEDALLDIFGTMLSDAGWQVDTATNGRSALALVESKAYDAILSDIDMPAMNGMELLREVRGRDLDVPVLLVTGHPRIETAVEAVEHGALRYLLKPVPETELLKAVEEAARLHRMARLKREALGALGLDDRQPGDRAGLEAAFERALATLRLVYQPIFHAAGPLFGHEALVRTSEATLPQPGALFDAAERLQRVHDIGRGVRDSAASYLARASTNNLFLNLHATELTDPHLYSAQAPLSPYAGRVVLEITERSSFERVPELRTRIQSLRALGYRIAVDDLGAGYAGLTSFAALQPDVVKLDMSLVRNVDLEPVKQRLIGSMTGLSRELGILVVAEGIETPAERDAVALLGCDLMQGFLLGRPVEVEDLIAPGPTLAPARAKEPGGGY